MYLGDQWWKHTDFLSSDQNIKVQCSLSREVFFFPVLFYFFIFHILVIIAFAGNSHWVQGEPDISSCRQSALSRGQTPGHGSAVLGEPWFTETGVLMRLHPCRVSGDHLTHSPQTNPRTPGSEGQGPPPYPTDGFRFWSELLSKEAKEEIFSFSASCEDFSPLVKEGIFF